MNKVSVTQHWTDDDGHPHSRRVFHGSDAAYDIWLDSHAYLSGCVTLLCLPVPRHSRTSGSDLTGRTQASEGGGGKTSQPLMMDGCHSTRAGAL